MWIYNNKTAKDSWKSLFLKWEDLISSPMQAPFQRSYLNFLFSFPKKPGILSIMGNESIVQPSPPQGQAKFKTLFFALLILLVLFPFLIEKSDSGKYIDIALDIILLTGVYVVSNKKSQMIIALCFAIPGLLISGENFYTFLSRGFTMESLAIVGSIFKIGE